MVLDITNRDGSIRSIGSGLGCQKEKNRIRYWSCGSTILHYSFASVWTVGIVGYESYFHRFLDIWYL